MLASALAMLFNQAGRKTVACDCDVDAPNLAIWLNEISRWDKIEKFSVSSKPVFDYKKCNGCGKCVDVCQFNALKMVSGKPHFRFFYL